MAWLLIITSSMQIVALTVWNGIISPVFDAATTFLLLGRNGEREIMSTGRHSPVEVTALLTEKEVSTVICGAISLFPARLLARNDITVVPWIRGDVEEVINAYRRGNLDTPRFRMPGCACVGRGRKRRCRRHRNHPPERQP